MSRFVDLTTETANPAQREILEGVRAQFGMIPPAAARMAHSPELFRAFMAGTEMFERTSLTPVEREVVILVLARDIGCDVCTGIHTAIVAKLGARPVAGAINARETLTDPRLAALADFTVELLVTRGDVGAAPWEAFLAAGFTRAQALEILIGVGVYTTSTYANRLTGS